jgi:multiple sugar transport system ATP-binding protein
MSFFSISISKSSGKQPRFFLEAGQGYQFRMPAVLVENLCKTFPGDKKSTGKLAVDHVFFEVESGEFLVLVGPSGCGKSTTLRLIAGLEEISSGKISIGGKEVNDVPPKDRDIAMVFQNYALYPHMSVFENMAFGLTLRGLPSQEIQSRVEEAAAALGLTSPDNLLPRKPKALSGGQRQRVALGRAMVRKPKVFLFDEPLSNLDAKMRVEMRNEISSLHRRLGATMVYVTHDQVEAMTMADRIVVMNQGRVQQIATPRELYARPANRFVAGFIGSPPMNFLRGTLANSGGQWRFRETAETDPITLVLPGNISERIKGYQGREVILGLRPESLDEFKADMSEQGGTFEALLLRVESVVPETLLYLQTGGHRLVARLSRSELNQPEGKKIRIQADMTQTHFFDPHSGLSLSP